MPLIAWSLFQDVAVETLAAWAAIFSGLAVVGVIWLAAATRKLAQNQVKLGLMLEALVETLKQSKR